jgi:hypothetical protein
MKKLLVLSMVLVSFVSCSKEDILIPDRLLKTNSIEDQRIGCICKDGSTIVGSGLFPYTANTKLNVVVDTSECNKIRIGEIWEKYYTYTQNVWNGGVGYKFIKKYEYTYRGFNHYLYNNSNDLNRILTYKPINYRITIDTARTTPTTPKTSGCVGKRTTSVQCSGTTQKGKRCGNMTLNCSGRCHLH